MSQTRIRILLVDDHAVVREGLRAPVPTVDPRPILTMADMGMDHGQAGGEHSGHDMGAMQGMAGMDHGQPANEHAGHDMSGMNMQGMDTSSMDIFVQQYADTVKYLVEKK